MPLDEILLCGTVHIDPKGPSRLRRLIEYFKPDQITVEQHPDRYKTHLGLHNFILACVEDGVLLKEVIMKSCGFTEEEYSLLNEDTVRQIVATDSFEIWVPAAYQEKTGVPVVPIDMFSEEDFQDFMKKCGPMVKELFKKSPQEISILVAEYYNREQGVSHPLRDLAKIPERNRDMANVLRGYHGKTLHVGGNEHVLGSAPNLYQYLAGNGHQITPVKLCYADYL